MVYNMHQLRSYALTSWEFRSLETHESFCECPVHFLNLIPA